MKVMSFLYTLELVLKQGELCIIGLQCVLKLLVSFAITHGFRYSFTCQDYSIYSIGIYWNLPFKIHVRIGVSMCEVPVTESPLLC